MRAKISLITIFLAILSALTLLGCSPRNKGTPSSWANLQITGKSLELIDSTQIETYQFLKNGIVAVTIGEKNGQAAAPILYWKIEHNNLLIAETQEFKAFESFSTPYLNGNIITVEKKIFRWSQFKLTQ